MQALMYSHKYKEYYYIEVLCSIIPILHHTHIATNPSSFPVNNLVK